MQRFTTQEQDELTLVFSKISKIKSSKLRDLITKIFKF